MIRLDLSDYDFSNHSFVGNALAMIRIRRNWLMRTQSLLRNLQRLKATGPRQNNSVFQILIALMLDCIYFGT
nr:hypothetical protein [Tanacetum cinerariifolium]